jgi:phage gp45-like
MSLDRSTNTFSRQVRSNYNQNTMEKDLKIPAGIYRGIVVDNIDPIGMGRVKVHISKFYGIIEPGLDAGTNIDPDLYLGAQWCRVLVPMGGTSQPAAGGQVAYGINGFRPSIDNEVLVSFGGDSASGIVIGSLPDEQRVGNTSAGPSVADTTDGPALAQERSRTATSTTERPAPHPQQQALENQGLGRDRIRGLNYSSLNRDPTPRVMGITSPAGHAIVLDDGSLEDQSFLGMRMRSSGGNQVFLDDTNGLIYLINRDGTSWVEMNRNGDIDIYSAQSINIATPGDMNFDAGGSINMQAGKDLNLKALGARGIKIEAAGGTVDIYAATNLNLQADANGNLLIAGNYRESAARIDMNGPTAQAATRPQVTQLAGNTNVTESIANRVPEAEPWAGHLDVSVLDNNSASGAASGSESQSYYQGTPSNPTGVSDQGGNFDINNFPDAPNTSGSLIQWASGVDRRVNPKLLQLTEEVARRFGRPLTIVSGYRSPSRNANAGGAKRSQHMLGNAIDISGSGLTNQDRLNLTAIASSVGIKGIGVYSGGSLHFDVRDGARAGWGSDYTRSSVPSYAVSTLDTHRAGGFA